MGVSTPCCLSTLSNSEQLCRVVLQRDCIWLGMWLYRDPRPTGDFVCLGRLTYRGGCTPPNYLASGECTPNGRITRTDSRSQTDGYLRVSECGGEVEERNTGGKGIIIVELLDLLE